MKVLAINGSPNKAETTFLALKAITDSLQLQGVETEVFHIGTGPIQCCIACGTCSREGKCVYDDGVNDVVEKLKIADGLVISAPTYFGGIAGGAKCFYDRLFLVGASVKCKPCAVAAVARRTGGEDVYHQLCNYLTLAGAIIAPTNYWNVAYGHHGEEVLQDEEGICILQKVGESMAWLIKLLAATRDTLPPPDMSKEKKTSFIR